MIKLLLKKHRGLIIGILILVIGFGYTKRTQIIEKKEVMIVNSTGQVDPVKLYANELAYMKERKTAIDRIKQLDIDIEKTRKERIDLVKKLTDYDENFHQE